MDFIKVVSSDLIAATAKLARDIWTDYYIGIVTARQVEYMLEKFQSEPAISEQISQGWIYYLLYDSNEYIGYFALIPDEKNASVKLSKYYIRKDKRGNGFGKKCMDFIVDICRDMKAATLWLTVNKENDSVKIYQKLGFKKEGSIVADIGNGFIMDDYKMVKQIKY